MKDTLFHINWGDGDTTFVIAPDEQAARERMGDGKDMVNYIVRLDNLYQMIYKAGAKDERERIIGIINDLNSIGYPYGADYKVAILQALKDYEVDTTTPIVV